MMPDNAKPLAALPSTHTPSIGTVRSIAQQRLEKLNRTPESIQESYLLAGEKFSGVRYSAGPFQLIWKRGENHATLSRGTLIIESIALTNSNIESDQRPRRAA